MKCIVLFDMDGTLTEPREKIEWSTIVQLKALQKIADIGIVSGSPYDYIEDQISSMWSEINSLDPRRLIIMPCNGTKIYEFTKENVSRPGFVKTYESSMIQYVGKEKYRILMSILTELQRDTIDTQKKLPLSGNFISFRESMVNWCMIGRDANHEMRSEFKSLDDGLRIDLKTRLDKRLVEMGLDNIVTSLGGNTSIDIYPKGWDKTYCLSHIPSNKKIYFVGDKCSVGGNDYELYESNRTIAYQTDGPAATLQIISNIKKDILNG